MEIIPRFEFRVWGEHLDSAQARLLDMGTLRERRQSGETYIVSRAEQTNVKIRAGVIDIKELLERRGALERWRPVFKAAFPIERQVAVGSVFSRLDVEAPGLEADLVGEEMFVAAADRVEGVTAVPVRKERSLLSIGDCRAEVAVVTIYGDEILTMAIESADPTVVESVAAMLGIDDHENESYPAVLRRLGWA